VLDMLKAAMPLLRLGDPRALAVDVGPVIDQEARDHLQAHIEAMRRQAFPVFQLPLPAECGEGCFIAPTLIEIDRLSLLQREVFGPVVHVLRFNADELPVLVEQINATGYGLTLGIHSRIDETIGDIVARAQVGNIYVNRNMVGAVVGVQPFGGEGLSGTGPKAGGPLYLARLADQARLPAAFQTDLEVGARMVGGEPWQAFAEWASAQGETALAKYCRDCGASSLLGKTLALPGPTGERNTLRFAPRGRLLCLATSREELFRQLAAVLATGNRPAMVEAAWARQAIGAMPAAIAETIEWRAAGDFAGLAGVLGGDEPALRQQLAAGTGALLALYCPAPNDGSYPLYRMVAERVVSVNTTAAGGNTNLMSLGLD